MNKLKTKSAHHQSENTFKFQTFYERLNTIHIDVARKFGRISASPEDAATFFGEALNKWTDFNCTAHYVSFRREIQSDVQSLTQLLFHKNEIASVLQKHLKVPNSLALEPILDLVVQFARDLQGDFYPFFEDFLAVIVSLLNIFHHNVELLESAFKALAYIFKFLWRLMVKDIKHIYTLFSPLLGGKHREYINNFAAESFSFLMRKNRHTDDFVYFMFQSLEESPDQVSGVGRLLFEMMKGVQGGFHSSTEKTLPCILKKLGEEALPWKLTMAAVQSMWTSIMQHTNPEQCQPLWNSLLGCLSEVHTQLSEHKSEILTQHCDGLLTLLHKLLTFKAGSLISKSADKIVQVLQSMFLGKVLPPPCDQRLLQCVAALLLAHKGMIAPLHRPKLISMVYKMKSSQSAVFQFTSDIFSLPLFEKDVLPALLQYCHDNLQKKVPEFVTSTLCLLTSLLNHKLPHCTGVWDPSSSPSFCIDFNMAMKSSRGDSKSVTLSTVLLRELEQQLDSISHDIARLWAVLRVLPHCRPLETDAVASLLLRLIVVICGQLTKDELDTDMSDGLLCVLREAVTSLHHVDSSRITQAVTIDSILHLVRKWPASVHQLRMTEHYFCVASQEDPPELVTEDLFEKVYSALQLNLSSPQSQVRLVTLHILCQFPHKFPTLPEGKDLDQPGVFRICLDAEEVGVQVHTYRDKIMHLRKLQYDNIQNQIPGEGKYVQVPLQYLIGMLYVNFRLLWEPVIDLINSQAVSLSRTQFWNTWSTHLQTASDFAEKELTLPRGIKHTKPSSDVSNLELGALYDSYNAIVVHKTGHPDHVNFRHQLWKTMLTFPEACETKSRILSPLLFKFLEKEYYPADLNIAPSQDIRKKEDTAVHKDITNEEEIPEEEKDDDDDENEEEQADDGEELEDGASAKKQRRAANKTLLLHMTLFAKFKMPKSLYMEPKLRELYFKLLEHRDLSIQKVAFQCVMAYNYKYLTPYRENFDRLLDDRSFKNEIILFSIDKETSVIDAAHREELLPVLMSLLYGKMQTKTGKDSGGRTNSQYRKVIILRFLAGCQPGELAMFLDLVFKPFKHLITDNSKENVRQIMSEVDLSKVIPLRKLQGLCSTVDLLLKKLGSLLGDYLHNILCILVSVGAICATALDRRQQINLKAVAALKSVRQAVGSRLLQFFVHFEKYIFALEDIDAMFEALIWPQVERLSVEGVYSPTVLLKMFCVWTQNTRYLPLLVKVHPLSPALTPLPHVFSLLHAKGVHASVVSLIMDMVENLLIEEVESEPLVPLECEVSHDGARLDVGPTVDVPAKEGVAYGTRLLLPHVPAVLAHLKGVVAKLGQTSGKIRFFPSRELNILSRLSVHVSDGDQAAEVVQLLLPFLGRRVGRGQDTELDILTTVKHLLCRTSDPQNFLRPLAKLFSVLATRASRTALCEVVQELASIKEEYAVTADIVTKLNAWDLRRVEEPDYLQRLTAFKTAQKVVAEGSPPDNVLLLMLTNNCCHFLSTIEDMSLRDTSTFTLMEMIKHLAQFHQKHELIREVITDNLLPEIKLHIKHKNEVARHEFINILACLVKSFPHLHVLDDLSKLIDEDEMDVDFFVNITHIQHHRRGRGMRRLSKHLATVHMKTDTLVHYLLPMITVYVRDDTYAKSSGVQEAAVDTIGAVCQYLPWPRYQLILKFYLSLLTKVATNQKLMVRVLVAVLNGFHFDLSNSEGVDASFAGGRDKPEVVGAATIDVKPKENKGDESKTDGDLDEEEKDEEVDEDEVSEMKSTDEVSTPGTIQQCSVALATKIHRVIAKSIIPQLHRLLTQKSKSDDVHTKAQTSKYAEDEEILRVPIALAMVKLLQALPKGTLQQTLPSILLKVAQFLRSRAQDIRDTARDTLIKMMQTLGPVYFPYTLRELRSSLQRGYQVHVLCFTVWALLKSMAANNLKTGDLDSSMTSLIEVFNEELFGSLAEEKDVQGIVTKLREARSSKSFDSYGIMSKFVSKETLSKVVIPMKKVIDDTHSHKKSRKVAEVLHKVGLGLVDNEGLPLDALLTFIYGLTNDAIPQLQPTKDKQTDADIDPRHQPPSALLITPERARGNRKPKMHHSTNIYIIVEFGLQLLNLLLKRSRLKSTEMTHLQMLDPFVEPITTCLSSKHVKVVSAALRCLLLLLKYPLPSLKSQVPIIGKHLFVLLNNYAAAGAAKGDNLELVAVCFKAVTVLVRDVTYHSISTDQLHVLLGYTEQDMHDHSRHATAFTLLKAILSRKLVCPEVQEVMTRTEQLSITSDLPYVRLQCRQAIMHYILNYPLGNKIKQHLEFYVTQLDYDYESGRESALEMLASIFASFPQHILAKHSGLFFIPLSSRLVNDESPGCRKLAGLALKSLLGKLASEDRDQLFNLCTDWLQADKISIRQLGALTCGLFVEVETSSFERHLKTVLPLFLHQVDPQKYTEPLGEKAEWDRDHLLFHLLSAIVKICRECSVLRGGNWAHQLNPLWGYVQQHLLFPNTWVRLTAARLYGLLFSAWTPQELVDISQKSESSSSPSEKKRRKKDKADDKPSEKLEYFQTDSVIKIHDLCQSCCKQLASPELDTELAEQALKNLVFLAKYIIASPGGTDDLLKDKEKDTGDAEKRVPSEKRACLPWLLRKMIRESKLEAAQSSKGSLKRSSVFKLIAAVSVELGTACIPPLLPLLLSPLVRQTTAASPNPDVELQQLCTEVLDLVKTTAGIEVFTREYATTHKSLMEKRSGRKQDRALMAVANPEITARKKIKKNLAKKETMKRKLADFRPTRNVKKPRMKEVAVLH